MSVETTGGPATTPGAGAAPAGTRPARPDVRRGSVRPAGRRGGAVLPPARPRVAGGTGRTAGGVRPVPSVVVRRRRAVAVTVLALVLGVLIGVLVSLVGASGTVGSAATGGAVPAATTVTVVGGGESLTAVARRTVPGADTDAVVTRIRELNGLDGAAVPAGRPLVVPAGPPIR